MRKSQENWARSNVEEAHTFAKHLADISNRICQKQEPEELEGLIQHQEALTNSNSQSYAPIQQSSRNHQQSKS
jgi:hypothetical protein